MTIESVNESTEAIIVPPRPPSGGERGEPPGQEGEPPGPEGERNRLLGEVSLYLDRVEAYVRGKLKTAKRLKWAIGLTGFTSGSASISPIINKAKVVAAVNYVGIHPFGLDGWEVVCGFAALLSVVTIGLNKWFNSVRFDSNLNVAIGAQDELRFLYDLLDDDEIKLEVARTRFRTIKARTDFVPM